MTIEKPLNPDDWIPTPIDPSFTFEVRADIIFDGNFKKLTGNALKVYLAMLMYETSAEDDCCFATVENIIALTGLTQEQIHECIDQLEEYGFFCEGTEEPEKR